VNAWRNDPLMVNATKYGKLRFWRHTSVAKSFNSHHQEVIIIPAMLGHEWDEDIDNGYRPTGLIHLSETSADNVLYIQDHGSVYDSGSAIHHLTLYRSQISGALVFGAGTVQWAWGLDNFHDCPNRIPADLENLCNVRVGVDNTAPNRDVQQVTINVLADMGVFPMSLEKGLTLAKKSRDDKPPRSTPLKVKNDEWLKVEESCTDDQQVVLQIEIKVKEEGGGVVAGVDVSVNDQKWSRAQLNDASPQHETEDHLVEKDEEKKEKKASKRDGTENWLFLWKLSCNEIQNKKVFEICTRAVDDSCNVEKISRKNCMTVNIQDKTSTTTTEQQIMQGKDIVF